MAHDAFELTEPRDPTEVERLGLVLSDCFPQGFTGEMAKQWPKREAGNRMQVLRQGDEIIGGTVLMDVAQNFGNRWVPMCGVRLVGIAPESRSRGAAKSMMSQALRQMREEGLPISMLYPATQPLYRSVGYDLAGARTQFRLPLSGIKIRDDNLGIERDVVPRRSDLEPVYERYALEHPGHIRRGEFLWRRALDPIHLESPGLRVFRAVDSDQATQGYVCYSMTDSDVAYHYDLSITDFVAHSPEAARRLWSHIAANASMGQDVRWHGSPHSALLSHLPEQNWKIESTFLWMLRVVDVVSALEARGYASDSNLQLHLQVDDPILPWNDGAFVLEVEQGQGRVRSGGEGDLRLDARGLATLYAGFQSAEELAMAGRLRADAQTMARATRLFHSESAWTPDMF